jgi:F0F1-type ATP synthase assembly protein I
MQIQSSSPMGSSSGSTSPVTTPVSPKAPVASASAASMQKSDTYTAEPLKRSVKTSSSENKAERRNNTIKTVATVGLLAAGIGVGLLLGGPIGAILGLMVALVIGGGLAVWNQQKAATAAAAAQAAQPRPNTYPMGTPVIPPTVQFSAPAAAEQMPGQQDVQTRRDTERQS